MTDLPERSLETKFLHLVGWGLKAIREADDLGVAKALAEALHEIPLVAPEGIGDWEKTFWEYHIAPLPENLRDQVCTYAKENLDLQPDRYIDYKTLYRLD